MGITMAKLTALVFSLLVLGGEVFAQAAVPKSWTTNFRLRQYATGVNPGSDSLNANWSTIDSAIQYPRRVHTDTVKEYTAGGGVVFLDHQYMGGAATPGAILHLAAGTADTLTAPLKIEAGTLLTNPEPGAIETDGDSLYFTNSSGVRRGLALATDTASFRFRVAAGAWAYDSLTVIADSGMTITASNDTITFKSTASSLDTTTALYSRFKVDSLLAAIESSDSVLYATNAMNADTADYASAVAAHTHTTETIGPDAITVGDNGERAIAGSITIYDGVDASKVLDYNTVVLQTDLSDFLTATDSIAYATAAGTAGYADSAGVLTYGSKTIYGALDVTSTVHAIEGISTHSTFTAGVLGATGAIAFVEGTYGESGTLSPDVLGDTRSWTLPNKSGTVALTIDTVAGATNATYADTADYATATGSVAYADSAGVLTYGSKTIYGALDVTSSVHALEGISTHATFNTGVLGATGAIAFVEGTYGETGTLSPDVLGDTRAWTLPNASGTLALTTDTVTAAHGLDRSATIILYGGITVGQQAASAGTINFAGTDIYHGTLSAPDVMATGNRGWTFPDASGEIALTSSSVAYATSAGSASSASSVPWSGVTDPPATYAPSSHGNAAHSATFLTAESSFAYANLTGVPSTFTPASHGNEAHAPDFLIASDLNDYATEDYVNTTMSEHIATYHSSPGPRLW